MPKTVEYELRNSKFRPQTSFLKDFLQNLAFLSYFRPWGPSHWIRSVFLINLGTENARIRKNKVIVILLRPEFTFIFDFETVFPTNAVLNSKIKVKSGLTINTWTPNSRNHLNFKTAFPENTVLNSGSLRGEFKTLSSSRCLV